MNTIHSKARKDYLCLWCNKNIPKGEIYSSISCFFEGEREKWHMHKECDILARTLANGTVAKAIVSIKRIKPRDV